MSDDKVVCCKCNNEINKGSIVTALSRKWHPECFKCFRCEKPISGQFNTPPGNTDPCCAACYKELFSPKCKKCGEAIANEKYVNYEADCYHQACFNCNICGDSLVDKPFILKEDQPACTKHAG